MSGARVIGKVLLVDDEPDIRRIGQLSLERVGRWQVAVAASGAEALAVAARERPDVILLDVMMPVDDGPTTLARLRERPDTADIPVIFMTAKVLPHELQRWRELGAAGTIPKPFDPMTLPDEVRRVLAAAEAP
ncbi:response regulator [Nannocystis pusilla]|uniref:response regulator n=1 Tax=Nannocystis pusilla TaxID=889268 RepID=UPI003BF2CD7C